MREREHQKVKDLIMKFDTTSFSNEKKNRKNIIMLISNGKKDEIVKSYQEYKEKERQLLMKENLKRQAELKEKKEKEFSKERGLKEGQI